MGIITSTRTIKRPAIINPLNSKAKGLPGCTRMHMVFDKNGAYDDTLLASTRAYSNLVTNGDFSDGTTGYVHYSTYSTESVVDGWLRSTKNTVKPYYGRQDSMGIASGSKVYISTYVRSNQTTTAPYFMFASGNIGLSDVGNVNWDASPIATFKSSIITTSGTANSWYIDSAAGLGTDGDYHEMKNPLIVNLTAIFGAGNEPSLTECDALFPFTATSALAQYTHKGTVSGATQVGLSRYLDATDDDIKVANSPLLDITAAPLSVGIVFKIPTGSSSGMLYGKATALINTQFGIYWNATNPHIDVYLNGTVVASSANNSAPVDTILEACFIWENGILRIYINAKASGSLAPFSTTLTSRADIYFGRVATTYTKMYLYSASQYAGNTFNAGEILEHRREIMVSMGMVAASGVITHQISISDTLYPSETLYPAMSV